MRSARPLLRLVASLALLALLASSGTAQAEPAEPIEERQAVREALSSNPGLQAVMADAESAGFGVVSEEGRYPYVFIADVSANRVANTLLGREPGEAPVSMRYLAQSGLELRKRYLLGTEVSLRVDATWQQFSGPPFAGGPPLELGPGYGAGVRFAIVQPLLRGAGVSVNETWLRQAEERKTAAELARDRTASELVRSVVVAYWELWYSTRVLEIQRASLALTERQRGEASRRAELGALPPVDVLSFETRVASRVEDVVDAELEQERRAAELSRLVGSSARDLRAGSEPPDDPGPPPENAVERAMKISPEVKEGEAALRLAAVQAETAGDPQRSRLDLDAFIEARGLGIQSVPAAMGQLSGLDAVSAHVGLTYELPLDDSPKRAALSQARLAVQSARARLEEARQRVEASATTELRREAAARRRVELSQRTAEVAARQLASEEARYATGASTPVAVLEAEEQLRSARLRVARAQVDLASAAIELGHLTGTLLSQYRVRFDGAGGKPRGWRPTMGPL